MSTNEMEFGQNWTAVVQNPDISSGFHLELRELAGRAGDRFARPFARRKIEQPA